MIACKVFQIVVIAMDEIVDDGCVRQLIRDDDGSQWVLATSSGWWQFWVSSIDHCSFGAWRANFHIFNAFRIQ